MTAGSISEWEQRSSRPRGAAVRGVRCQCAALQGGSGPTKSLLLLVIAGTASVQFATRAASAPAADPLEQTLADISKCVAKPLAPWPSAWQEEYVHTVREAIGAHQDVPQYAQRLQMIRQGFPPYWEGLRRARSRPSSRCTRPRSAGTSKA